MSGGDFDFEPERGLPARLPDGERVLWKGAPLAVALAVRALHVRKVAVYFLLLGLWKAFSAQAAGAPVAEAAMRFGAMAILGIVAIGILGLIAWGYARTTVYTLTDKRLVIRSGIAIPVTINLPFTRIDGASLKLYGDNTGDIPLTPNASDRVPAILLWPHLRPWRLRRPEPMLRCIPDAVHVAALLTTALKGQSVRIQSADIAAAAAGGLPQPA
ncbi:MAG: photosynthetic complex putative assembly protein PuhB [Beijerinckiaceae bacterium]